MHAMCQPRTYPEPLYLDACAIKYMLPALLLPAHMGPPHSNKNLGDGIDYGQRFGHFGERITECLQTLEINGGPDALVNLKYCLPLYESALMFQ